MEKMVKWEALQDNQKVTGLICGLDIMWQSDLILSLFQHAGVSFITTFTLPSVSFPLSQNHVTIVFSFCAWTIETFHSFRGISWNTSWMVLEKKKKMLLFTRISWSSSSSHSSGSFPHLSLVFWGNTHHQHSPWMKRFSINQLTPDLRSNQVISLLLFSRSFSLSTDKSPHTKSDSLFQFINNARLLFISSTSTDWFETDWFCSV